MVRKVMLFIFLLFLLPPTVLLLWMAIFSGERVYTRHDLLSYWLYTPKPLINMPTISPDATYSYSYDVDSQITRLTITWRNIADIPARKMALQQFIKNYSDKTTYDCAWVYQDNKNYRTNFQRYCISQQKETLELAFFEIHQ